MILRPSARRRATSRRTGYGIGAAAIATLAVSALVNYGLARRAERHHQATGRFIDIDGVSLHYVERGTGDALVLLHGNGSMIEDFASSGLLDLAARKYRVLAFDRPGYGHSTRPRRTIWTADKQADLIHEALTRLGVTRALALGHSWGCSVAVALARKYPAFVGGLVLASGYYYPSLRGDAIVLAGPAVPVLGDILRYTLAPILGRMIWSPMIRKLFGPETVPEKFAGFPKAMALRPSQIRASAAESALLIPAALAARAHYGDLKMPVVIVAGTEDRIVDFETQSARLHGDIAHSTLHPIPGAGHMIHQTATDAVMAAIDEAAAKARSQHKTKAAPVAA
jgi:pimeloyl-ACP methyl ester carboxylesterase